MTKINDKFVIPPQVINDCVSRFLMAQGDKILRDKIHFCSYLEQAFWFYIDMWVEEDGSVCKEVSFEKFVERVCEVTELPIPENLTAIELCLEFKEFKHKVNTYGGILINPELNKVLMVQCFNGRSWGFPKGKIEQRESFPECAIREVKEEIDYDMTPHINPELFLEATILEQKARLYIIYGVPEETVFKTNTRKEIGNIRWFNIDTLPLHRRDKKALSGLSYTPNNFFIVIPFVKMLKDHIAKVRENCLRLFNMPYFDQELHYYEYLKCYFPEIYKIRIEHQIKRERQYSMSEDNKVPASSSKSTTKPTNILDMLQSAMVRGQSQSPAVIESNEGQIPLSEVAINTPPPLPPQLPSPLARTVKSKSNTKTKKKAAAVVKTEPVEMANIPPPTDVNLMKTEQSTKEDDSLKKFLDGSLNSTSNSNSMNQSISSAPLNYQTSGSVTHANQSFSNVAAGYPQNAPQAIYPTPVYSQFNNSYTPFGSPARPLYYPMPSVNTERNVSNSAPYPYRNQLIYPRPASSNPGFPPNIYGAAYPLQNQNLYMSPYRPQVGQNLQGGIIQALFQNSPQRYNSTLPLVQNPLGGSILQPLVQQPQVGMVPTPFPVMQNNQVRNTAPNQLKVSANSSEVPTNPVINITSTAFWNRNPLNFNGCMDAAMKEMNEGMQKLLSTYSKN